MLTTATPSYTPDFKRQPQRQPREMNPISAHVVRHHELTTSLKELEHVHSSLAESRDDLAEVRSRLAKEEKGLRAVSFEQKVAYQKWQDSRTPSLFTRLRHPKSHQVLAAQTEKQAVHEYEKYFNEGQALSTRVERDTAAVAALVEQVESLEIMARHRDMLREELLAMYDRVFAGPTPAYPHEDAAEDSMTVAAIEAVTARDERNLQARAMSSFPPLLDCAERAERQWRKAQKSGRDANGNSRAPYHRRKAKDNYRLARTKEAELCALKPNVGIYPGDLPASGFLESRDSPRKHFCRGWLVHIRNKHAETTVELFQAEQVLRAAEATLAERTEALEDIRRAIFEEREVAAGLVPTPPQYIYGA